MALTEAPETIDDEVRILFTERKLQRKSAWEQLRAGFGQLYDLTKVMPDNFKLPNDWVARPVQEDEVRIHLGGRAAIVERSTQKVRGAKKGGLLLRGFQPSWLSQESSSPVHHFVSGGAPS